MNVFLLLLLLLYQAGQASPLECQEIRRALEDGALDVLAPQSTGQKEIGEFRERVLRWIDDFDQHVINSSGNFIFTFHFTSLTVVKIRCNDDDDDDDDDDYYY